MLSRFRTEWFAGAGDVRREALAGIVVALALIPEAIGFSIIAGFDPSVGVYASVAIAIIISLLVARRRASASESAQIVQTATAGCGVAWRAPGAKSRA